jgi:hypothetical protein
MTPCLPPLFHAGINTALPEGDICTLCKDEIDLDVGHFIRVANKTGGEVNGIRLATMRYSQKKPRQAFCIADGLANRDQRTYWRAERPYQGDVHSGPRRSNPVQGFFRLHSGYSPLVQEMNGVELINGQSYTRRSSTNYCSHPRCESSSMAIPRYSSDIQIHLTRQ